MKKQFIILAMGVAILVLAGCGNSGSQNDAAKKAEETMKKVEQADSGIVVPENVYKECPGTYFEKPAGGSVKDCATFGGGPVCVYYKLKKDNKIHVLQQTTECHACRNYGQPDRKNDYDEFLGMTKGECAQGMYKKK